MGFARGDFGIWPDPERIDRAARSHDGAGDFSEWLRAGRRAPRQTIFIKGNHEDFAWLEAQMPTEVLPSLVYLRNGCRMDLESASGGRIRVGGVGGCYGPSDYSRVSEALQGYARRHYTHDEVDRLGGSGPLDLLRTHDAPAGIQFRHHRRGPGYVSEAASLDILLGRVQPLVCVFGHHHARVDAEVAGVRCIGLNKIARPGNLIAIEIWGRSALLRSAVRPPTVTPSASARRGTWAQSQRNQEVVLRGEERTSRSKQAACQKMRKPRRSPERGGIQSSSTGVALR